MFKDFIARKIITARPLASALYERLSQNEMPCVEAADRAIQNLALKHSDFFTEKQWGEVQRIKLSRILTYAQGRIPYWRALFRSADFDAGAFGMENFHRIPPLTRAIIKQMPIREMTAPDVPAGRFIKSATSGSTGEPMNFFIDRDEIVRRAANTFQEMRYAGIPAHTRVLVLGLLSHRDLDTIGLRINLWDVTENARYRRSVVYPLLQQRGPHVLITTPSFLKLFADILRADGFHCSFEAILCRGEYFGEEEKKILSDFFNCRTFSVYGSKECSLIGLECSGGKTHLAPWMNYVEILGEDGSVLPDGTEGLVTVTSFENRVMPFIRYRIGDRGTLSYSSCSCGRNTPHIEFRGREADVIILPSGKLVPVIDFSSKLAHRFSRHVVQFQLEQLHDLSIVFNYKAAWQSGDADLALLTQGVGEMLPGACVTLKKVDTFIVDENGKCPLFVVKKNHTP